MDSASVTNPMNRYISGNRKINDLRIPLIDALPMPPRRGRQMKATAQRTTKKVVRMTLESEREERPRAPASRVSDVVAALKAALSAQKKSGPAPERAPATVLPNPAAERVLAPELAAAPERALAAALAAAPELAPATVIPDDEKENILKDEATPIACLSIQDPAAIPMEMLALLDTFDAEVPYTQVAPGCRESSCLQQNNTIRI